MLCVSHYLQSWQRIIDTWCKYKTFFFLKSEFGKVSPQYIFCANLILYSKQTSSIIVILNILHIIYEITWLPQVHAYQKKIKKKIDFNYYEIADPNPTQPAIPLEYVTILIFFTNWLIKLDSTITPRYICITAQTVNDPWSFNFYRSGMIMLINLSSMIIIHKDWTTWQGCTIFQQVCKNCSYFDIISNFWFLAMKIVIEGLNSALKVVMYKTFTMFKAA